MMLTRNRIWGNMVGTNDRSGYKQLKKSLMYAKARNKRYEFSQLEMMYPNIKNWEKIDQKKEKYNDRKLRIFMRGMKIGQQKGMGKSMDAMAVFEMTGKKNPNMDELGQKLAESSFSDDSLGISSSDKD